MKKTFALLLSLHQLMPAIGQTKSGTANDFVAWNKAVIQVSRIDSSRFSAGAEFAYRRIDHARTAQLFLGLVFVKFAIPRVDIDVSTTYALVHFYNYLGNADLCELALGRALPGASKGKLHAYAKLAVDRIIFPSYRRLDRWRYRAFLSAGHPLSKLLTLRAADEFLLSSLPGLRISENRGQAGLYARIGNRMEFGAAYLNRWVEGHQGPNVMEHTLLTEYIINL